MGDKARTPRIKEQHKDNAIAVKRNQPDKSGMRTEEVIAKVEETVEFAEKEREKTKEAQWRLGKERE